MHKAMRRLIEEDPERGKIFEVKSYLAHSP